MPNVSPEKGEPMSLEIARALYASLPGRCAEARERFGRPLTFTDKILVAHADDFAAQDWTRGRAMLALRPDRVAMQDATAQMALLQFMQSGRERVAVPSTIHCDHLIRARAGAAEDLARSLGENREVYAFLSSAARKYGIGFWPPGAGIIHQVVLENYAFPGGLMIGTDSHTPNGGGLGMLAVGVGGADAGEVMAGLAWEVLAPKLIGVRLRGRLAGWASPKDVILRLCGLLTVKGGTNQVLEFFGEGAASISCTGKATITNMGAELGATGSVFPFDRKMESYLRQTGRAALAGLAVEHRALLGPDPEVFEAPERFYDQIVDVDLSTLEAQIVGPHTPDLARPVSRMGADVKEHGYPAELRAALIGSCTNSSYEDMSRAAAVARQGLAAGLKARIPLYITPGSTRIYDTLERDGMLETFRRMGATVLANACGPCIGQWSRADAVPGRVDSIVSSFNRNFPGRNDGLAETMSFLASPEIVTALAFAGRLDFDPLNGTLETAGGTPLSFSAPQGDEHPARGFVEGDGGYVAPAAAGARIEIELAPDSERIQLLVPFSRWDGEDFAGLPVLLKTQGKTTTDHISPAGAWLRYRGHLDKISDNMFLGATNAFAGERGQGTDVLTGESGLGIAAIARRYQAQGLGSVVIGDENYGEGSSREHAAMSPRHLGVRVVIARSFARIHETNLKKQGILPLVFADPADWERIERDDRVSVTGLAALAPGQPVRVAIVKPDGRRLEFETRHSLTARQIEWFKAGSALNALRHD
jgi:aconitate hydratase